VRSRLSILSALFVLLVGSTATAYSPVLTPELVRQAGTFYFNLNMDLIPIPSEWAPFRRSGRSHCRRTRAP